MISYIQKYSLKNLEIEIKFVIDFLQIFVWQNYLDRCQVDLNIDLTIGLIGLNPFRGSTGA